MVSVWGRNDTKMYGNKQPSSVSFPNNHWLGVFLPNIPAIFAAFSPVTCPASPDCCGWACLQREPLHRSASDQENQLQANGCIVRAAPQL